MNRASPQDVMLNLENQVLSIEEEDQKQARSRERFIDRITFLTRALVKNNIISQNAYLVLLTIDYLFMVYYTFRLVDYTTLYKGFKFLEDFLSVDSSEGMSWDQVQSYQSGTMVSSASGANLNVTLNTYQQIADQIQSTAEAHVVINCIICGCFTIFILLFLNRIYRISNFDQTQDQSYSLKAMALFMVCSITFLKIPVITSITVVAKALSLGIISSSAFYVSVICNTVLAIEYLIVLLYTYRFFNLEVPNDEIPWSHNQTTGFYFKVILAVLLCSQDLYRQELDNSLAISIIILVFILACEIFILVYRMNTPSIFNTLVHDFTVLLETLLLTVSLIGLVSLVTQRDILSTLAYLCIFIPVIIKIFSSVDQSRKNYVLFKLKNEDSLSSNEYLIALTHLLKMVKRQSETDLAQLLSFTYYHKLYCYDLGCICQFFTQYCQDPQKFKTKKKRTYRGYKDDGSKLVQQVESEETQHTDTNQQDEPNSASNFAMLQSSGANASTKSPLSAKNTEASKNNGAVSTMQLGNPSQTVSGDEVTQIDLNQADMAVGYHNKNDNGNNEDSQSYSGANQFQQSSEYKERGVNALFNKSQVLKGNAFNGFDSNLDFKIKGEFKSPSQFKSTHESRTYFFTRLIETMFKQLEARTKKNTSFTLISIFFHFQYQHNIYLAAFTLVKLAKALNQSILAKMTFSVTEYYMLEQIMNEFKNHTKEEIDYSAFIESSQMQQRLDWLFEDASADIIHFWRLFKEEQANVQKAYLLAMTISKNIATIRDYTQQLEDKQLIKDYNKYYYYAMFYQNLLNDKQSYNQMISNLRNMLLMKNIHKKNSRFGMVHQDINDIGFAIFAVEDGGFGMAQKTDGKFLYCNKTACQILNISEEDVLGKPASALMPEQIRVNHELFVRRFFQDGLGRLVGKVRNMYIKDFNGYIKPCQFFINFYYTSKFSYSLIMHIDPILSMTYFGTSQLINMKYVMILLCDENNVIQNMTENVRKLMGLTHKKLREEEEILGRPLKIDDIIYQYGRIETTITRNKYNFLPNQQIRVRNFQGDQYTTSTAMGASVLNDIGYIPCSLTYEEVTYMDGFPGEFSQKVFMIIPITKVPEIIENVSGTSSLQYNLSSNPGIVSTNEGVPTSNESQTRSSNDINDPLTATTSSITSSSASGTSHISSTKNLLFQQKSPKILNLYLTIVFGVFICFMIVISINFIIYIQKKNNVNLEIQFNQIENQRNIYLSTTMLDLKQLQLIALDASSNTSVNLANQSDVFPSPYDKDRFGKYLKYLESDSNNLISNQNQFRQQSARYSLLPQDSKFEDVVFQTLSDRGFIRNDTSSLNEGIQLLLADIILIDTAALVQQKIPMNLMQQIKNVSSSSYGKVTELLKYLFYIYQNGMTSVNSLVNQESDMLLDSTVVTSRNSNLFINLISFISIGVITFIGIFTFPMLGKIEDRKISVLKFFNLLSVEQITQIIKKGEDYREEFSSLQRNVNGARIDNTVDDEKSENEMDEMSSRQPSAKSAFSKKHNQQGKNNRSTLRESKDGIQMYSSKDSKIFDSKSPKGLKQKVQTANASGIRDIFKKIKRNEDKQKEKAQNRKNLQKKNQSLSSGLQSAFSKDQGNDDKMEQRVKAIAEKYKVDEEIKEDEEKPSYLDLQKASPPSKASKKKLQSSDGKGKKAKHVEEDEESSDHQKHDESDSDEDTDEKSEEQDQKEKRKSKEKKRKAQDLIANSQSRGQHPENTRTDHITEHLEKVAFKEKIKLGVYVFVVLIFLNSCLIACFSIGQRTFKDDSNAIKSLTTFYRRQNCLENLLLYSYEQFIQNKTFEIDPSTGRRDAVQYYINYCQQLEIDYNNLRRSLPVYLADSQGVIDGIESSRLCKTIYTATDVQTIAGCENVFNQILQLGFTQALYSIFNYAQSLYVLFNNQQRTQAFLNAYLYQGKKLRDLTDLSKSYITDVFQYLQTVTTQTVLGYFDSLAQYYMIVYACYMGVSIVLCLIFGFFVFKKLRDQIMTSANILAIMPLEDLDTRDRQRIETFLNS